MSEEQSKGFKFKDNRRFDNDGNERSLQDEKPSPASTDAPKSNFTVKDQAKASNDIQEEAGVEFRSFVVSLATQALIQLGVMQPPEGMPLPVDKEAARQTIEILNMLHIKTKGNLDLEEKQLLDEVLHSLRMNFLRLS